MINILIADDHEIVVEGLRSLIEAENEISIIGEANNGEQVIPLLENNLVDVAVLDISMPKMDGVDLTLFIKSNYPKVKILILTMHNEIGFIRRVIEAGAHGYILKNKGKEELVRAIKALHSGNEYLGEEVTKTLFSSIRNSTVYGEIQLTKREKEVLKLIANGNTTPKISDALNIAHSTVETYRRNLLEKTGVKNSKGLVKFAIENGYH
ncbi:response regulator transcription factor [Polaribacter sp. Hel1_85]|uniref:response regulator transcription factor n=1 Tax=Polaribacter sp. Hel1_85 TaxID=1250005 RepID=UPI00052E324B|nr:response regulator transcription factor [Polaribacter sp. Hel1_85]KGL59119.1 transcriptional regulator, LuxR family [Polaribacter sp. Hel1_85]